MIKIILLLISLFAFSFAGQKNLYFGLGLGLGSGSYDLSSVDTFTYNPGYQYSMDSFMANVSLGYILSKKYRLEASYASISMSADDFFGDTPSDIGLEDSWAIRGYDFDFIYTVLSMSSKKRAVDFVVTLGQGFYRTENTGSTTVNRGRSTNYGLGALFSLKNDVEFEFSMKIKDITWEDMPVSGVLYSPTESMSLFYFAVKHKF